MHSPRRIDVCVACKTTRKTEGALEKERGRDGGNGQFGQGGVKRNTVIKQLIHAIHKGL